jgi:PKD repeat protein
MTQGCVIVDVPVGKSITVTEADKSGWRRTGFFADGESVNQDSYTYVSNRDQIKVLWFLNTFTPPTGGVKAQTNPSPSVTSEPTANTRPECVSLSASPAVGGADLEVTIVGKGRDPDGIIREMDFDFGDGTSDIRSVSGETNKDMQTTISHTFTEPGTYTATLRVKDNSGQANEWSSIPDSCKVTIKVEGEVLGGAETVSVTPEKGTEVSVLPKSGTSELLSLGYLVSGLGGIWLKKKKLFYTGLHKSGVIYKYEDK